MNKRFAIALSIGLGLAVLFAGCDGPPPPDGATISPGTFGTSAYSVFDPEPGTRCVAITYRYYGVAVDCWSVAP